MAIIKVEHLSFSYPTSHDMIFENVSFQIDTDWKLGLIGRNGKGKTTFLHLLLGKYAYSGKIISSVKFCYFPFAVSEKNRLTMEILQEICPNIQEWEAIKELSGLALDRDVLWQTFDLLSGGEQTKVLLAALFLNGHSFLLIDEPTNHLDTIARQQIADYLKKKKGFILVSHDRYLLDECVDHILSLNRANIEIQNGNFTSWLENFEKQQKSESEKNKSIQKDIERLQKAMQRTASWSDQAEASKFGTRSSGVKVDKGFVGHKSAKLMKRAKSIEARKQKEIYEKSSLLKNTEVIEPLKISPLSYHAEILVSFSDVSVSYHDKMIFHPLSFQIKRKERIALSGANGSGKSSLLKVLLGENIAYQGKVKIGTGLIISYVPQDTSYLEGRLSDFIAKNNIDESLFKAILRKMDFGREQFSKNIETYSEGQKKKLLIAKSLCEKAHLYVWDEPLNYIDIYSRIQIEQLINAYSPTMIFVEHDQKFQESIATKKIVL